MSRRLTGGQRVVIAEKLMDWGNLLFTGLAIAQFVPGGAAFQWWLFIIGVMGFGLAYLIGIVIMKTRGGD